jgi:hypothetical protein
MKLRLAAAIAAVAVATGCASGPTPETAGRFYFLVGCWRSADGLNQETWTAPVGGVMFGHAQSFGADGGLVSFEQSRIDLRTQPSTFVVSPNGQRAVTFVENPDAAPTDMPGVSFENAANEFPQRVSYRRPEKDLAATVSQLDGSRAVNYAWERCDD